ncbi:Fic family protein [Cellulomonas sp. Sa3CUA2]|uniref:Fic family protein n=1 Tax=Cellulomonas avistercoris TaxID=2762242 RepID=A0ABR8Q9H8_9CELL|nr:Fic family protein [Cellulomonas avistercoris]MBD7917075.1 Fic family protein [Cellulomonas avistercoris]
MRSFEDLDQLVGAVPFGVVADLRTVDAGRGSQPLHRLVLPELLEALAGHARTASTEASCGMDGIVVSDRTRTAQVLARRIDGLRDRDEQELAGYGAALDHLDDLDEDQRPRADVDLVLDLHRLLFRFTPTPGGRLRQVENVVAGAAPDGARVKRFTPVPVAATPAHLDELVARYRRAQDAGRHHPVVLVGLFTLDLLAIHPFVAGNGRVARMLTNALLQDAGYDVTRYVPVEPVMARSPERYSTALLDSTHDWHLSRHDPWPWLRYLVSALADVTTQLAALTSSARRAGSKQGRVRDHVLHHARPQFRISEVRAGLPDVSDQTIRLVLAQLRTEGLIEADGVGRSATWSRRG